MNREVRGKVGEGLGGCNVRGFEDPRTKEDNVPNSAQPRPTDPSWVHRRDPEHIEKGGLGEGVAYDPGAREVTSLEGSHDNRGHGGSKASSVTGIDPPHLAIHAPGSQEALGVRGSETQVGSPQGTQGAGPRGPDRAAVGDDTLVTTPGFGKDATEREKAGTPAGIQHGPPVTARFP